MLWVPSARYQPFTASSATAASHARTPARNKTQHHQPQTNQPTQPSDTVLAWLIKPRRLTGREHQSSHDQNDQQHPRPPPGARTRPAQGRATRRTPAAPDSGAPVDIQTTSIIILNGWADLEVLLGARHGFCPTRLDALSGELHAGERGRGAWCVPLGGRRRRPRLVRLMG